MQFESMHDLELGQSLLSEHSTIRHSVCGSPLAFGGHEHIAECALTEHSEFRPQPLGSSWHGFVQREFLHAAVFGQSESVKHSPGLRQPVRIGSPIRPSGQEQTKFPGTF